MTVIGHHAGEELILGAAIGSGLFSGALLFLRASIAQIAHRRLRRHP